MSQLLDYHCPTCECTVPVAFDAKTIASDANGVAMVRLRFPTQLHRCVVPEENPDA